MPDAAIWCSAFFCKQKRPQSTLKQGKSQPNYLLKPVQKTPRFAPIFGRFCSIFLHLAQELTPIFGESRNKFCNIFVTILPHLFRFGETSFYGGKKRRFSSFSGHRGGLFHRVLALSVIPSGCHLPRSGRQGLFRCILGSPFGRAVAVRRLRGLTCHFRQRPCPLRHGLRRATSPEVGGKGFCCGTLCTLT